MLRFMLMLASQIRTRASYIYIQPHDVELEIHIFPVSETSDDEVSIPWQTKDHGSSNFWLLKTGSRWGGKIALIE